MLSKCGTGEDSSESLGLQEDQTSQSWKTPTVNIHWKEWDWSWSSNTLATWCKEPTHGKRPWCWERLRARGESSNRGWDGWMTSLSQWTWIWVNSGRWERIGNHGMLESKESQTWLSDWTTTTSLKVLSHWGLELQHMNLHGGKTHNSIYNSTLVIMKTISMKWIRVLRLWDFPGGPVVRILPSSSEGVGLISDLELRSHMPCEHKNQNKTEAIL